MTPSLAAAVALHLLVILSGIIVWPYFGKPVHVVAATAVTLVSSANAPPPPALKAHEEQEAQAPEPTPTPAPPTPPPPPQPKPEPKPAPPQPAPPKPPTPAPTPKPAPKPKTDSLDLNALSSSLDKSTKSQPKAKTAKTDSLDLNALTSDLDKSAKPQASMRGASRFATALTARNDPGAAQTSNLIGSMIAGKVIPRWHPDCGGIGAGGMVVEVQVDLGPDGSLVRAKTVRNSGSGPVAAAAAQRAELALSQAAPFELPHETYNQWRSFIARFDAKDVCGG